MKNPCKNCIVKCNCTQICEEKKIYGIFLETKTATLYFSSSDMRLKFKKNDFEDYLKYDKLLKKNRRDKIAIINRRVNRRFPD